MEKLTMERQTMERHDVNDVIRSFLFSGMPIAKGEENRGVV